MVWRKELVPPEPWWCQYRIPHAAIAVVFGIAIYYAHGEAEVHAAYTADLILRGGFWASVILTVLFWLWGCSATLFLLTGYLHLMGWVIVGTETFTALHPFSNPSRYILPEVTILLVAGLLPRFPFLRYQAGWVWHQVERVVPRARKLRARLYFIIKVDWGG